MPKVMIPAPLFILLLSLFFSFSVQAEESVDTLLNEFTQKNDSSRKTIDENKGHLLLFSREKIEKMHASTLKDILKTTPSISYVENRYAIPDFLGNGISPSPFSSSLVRIYIDGIEVTHGWFGSGLILYGDMNIDFIDHIEMYYGIPSFENSSEPAYVTIFLYSKDASRDAGGKVNLEISDNGHNTESIRYGDVTESFSYLFSISHTKGRQNKIPNESPTPLSRDYKRTQLFGYLKGEKQAAHIYLISKDADSLAGLSWDATPIQSEIDYQSLHLDYSIDFNTHWHAQIAYDRLDTHIKQADDLPLMLSTIVGGLKAFDIEIDGSGTTAELSYQNTLGNHTILTGVKVRDKKLLEVKRKGFPSTLPAYNRETVSSIFLQDQYRFSDEHLLSAGIAYNHINRNGGLSDDDLLHFRLGYIYAGEYWSYKTYVYEILFAKDPIDITLLSSSLNPQHQTTWGYTQELSYKDEKQHARILFMALREKYGLTNPIPASDRDLLSIVGNYSYRFSAENTLDLQLHYSHIEDELNLMPEISDWGGYLSWSKRIDHFDIFNSLIWHYDDLDKTHAFDLSTAITWNASENLSFTLKGENLLNKGKKSTLFRIDPLTMTPMTPLDVPVSDRRITLQVEYNF